MRKLCVALLVVASCGLMAQLPSTEPPAEVKKFDWMIGKWKGAGSMALQGMEMSFTTEMTNSYEGQFLKSVSTIDYGMIQVTETMFTGFDPGKGEYFSYAFTNMAPKPRIEFGKLDGETLVMVSEPWEIMGQSISSRATMKKTSDTKARFVVEFKMGDAWEKATDMELTKEG